MTEHNEQAHWWTTPFEDLRVEAREASGRRIAVVTFDLPERRNSMSTAMTRSWVRLMGLLRQDRELAAVVARLRERVAALRHPVWTPHVTLARRVPQRLLPTAFEVLRSTETPRELIADRLRWWDPTLELIEDVATAPRA